MNWEVFSASLRLVLSGFINGQSAYAGAKVIENVFVLPLRVDWGARIVYSPETVRGFRPRMQFGM